MNSVLNPLPDHLSSLGLIPDIEQHDLRRPVFFLPRLGLKFVYVSAGKFQQGSQSVFGDSDEIPIRDTILTQPFLLSQTPCTQAAWRRGVGATGSFADIANLAEQAGFPIFGDTENTPIYHVNWYESLEWCRTNGLDLPTEAQWEYACRAGTKTDFWFGDVSADDANTLSRYMCYSENQEAKCPAVGQFPPNPWGFYDMHGTVWEWCLDAYSPEYYGVKEDVDPCNQASGGKRVHRGGAWDVPAFCCRSSARYRDAADYRLGSIGFRPAICISPV